MKKLFLVLFVVMILALVRDLYASGSLNRKVDTQSCQYQANFCEPYSACLNSAQPFGSAAFKTCAQAYVAQCMVKKYDRSGNQCTIQQGELAWGNIWK